MSVRGATGFRGKNSDAGILHSGYLLLLFVFEFKAALEKLDTIPHGSNPIAHFAIKSIIPISSEALVQTCASRARNLAEHKQQFYSEFLKSNQKANLLHS